MRCRRFGRALAAAAFLLFVQRASADEPASKHDEAEAYGRFERGLALLQQDALEPALAEFLASRALEPTRGNTQNAAICLKRLGRFDEALELLEALLRESSLNEADRRKVIALTDEVRRRVGTLDIDTLEPGAFVLVDGRVRGKTPLSSPLRVVAGSHGLRIVGEGLEPYETRIEVAGQQRVVIRPRLVTSAKTGRMTVVEVSGQPATVLLDNAPVGPAPWAGVVAPGVHAVALRADGRRGAQPVNAVVRADEHATIRLALETLDARVRIVPSPAGAHVALDGVELGHGSWQGDVRVGPHVVEAADEGYLPARITFTATHDGHQSVDVALERDPAAELWRRRFPPRIVLAVSAGMLGARSLGGDLATTCTSPCAASLPLGGAVGARLSYEFASGLGLGLALGYGTVTEHTTARSAPIFRAGAR